MTYHYSQKRFDLIVAGVDHPQRKTIESFIAKRYVRAFNATIDVSMPSYFALYSQGKLISACGVRSAAQGPLFLESYLSQPIESFILSEPTSVSRQRIVEVGQLAAFSSRFSVIHFGMIAKALLDSGFDWCTCTVTEPLLLLMKQMGLNPNEIVSARAEQVSHADNWGSYYQTGPRVVFGSLNQAHQRLSVCQSSSSLSQSYSYRA